MYDPGSQSSEYIPPNGKFNISQGYKTHSISETSVLGYGADEFTQRTVTLGLAITVYWWPVGSLLPPF